MIKPKISVQTITKSILPKSNRKKAIILESSNKASLIEYHQSATNISVIDSAKQLTQEEFNRAYGYFLGVITRPYCASSVMSVLPGVYPSLDLVPENQKAFEDIFYPRDNRAIADKFKDLCSKI